MNSGGHEPRERHPSEGADAKLFMVMRYQIFATDYDGTLAHHGTVSDSAVGALRRLRASGRTVLMVTGREIEDLKSVFAHLELFDVIVGENGALLYYPPTGRIKLLHEPPPPQFAEELRSRGVAPLSVGH